MPGVRRGSAAWNWKLSRAEVPGRTVLVGRDANSPWIVFFGNTVKTRYGELSYGVPATALIAVRPIAIRSAYRSSPRSSPSRVRQLGPWFSSVVLTLQLLTA